MKFLLICSALMILPQANAFAPSFAVNTFTLSQTQLQAQKIGSWDGSTGDFDPNSVGNSQIQSIEFKIYPDGRVEEKVHGVKGNNCHKVTEKINEQLGKVIESSPTEEMYEQEVLINTEETISNGVSTTTDGDSWEGQSSW